MHIEGKIIRLRAVEPGDIDRMYTWENDRSIWPVSGTTEPFSREQMRLFVERQTAGGDLLRTGQLRLIIEAFGNPYADTKTAAPQENAKSRTAPDPQHAAATPDHGASAAPDGISAPQHGSAEFPGNTSASHRTASASPDSTAQWEAVGAVDLFEFDPVNRRAGIGILIHAPHDRGKGYAADTIRTLCRYVRDTLGLHQLWCNVGADNEASLRLFRNAGFAEAGVKRDWLWRPDGYHDEVMMQKMLE